MGGTGGRRTAPGLALISALTAANARPDEEPRARARTHSRQSDRGGLRRHTVVGIAAPAINLKTGAISFAQRFLSGGS